MCFPHHSPLNRTSTPLSNSPKFPYFAAAMTNKITSVFLLLCLLAPGPLVYSWLEYQKKKVRKSVKWKMIEGIDKEELVLLKFTPEQEGEHLNWKHSKEFEYAGEMYDIVEQFSRNDTNFYYCWQDREETKLNKQLNQLIAGMSETDPQKNNSKNQWAQFFKSLYRSEPNPIAPSAPTEKTTHRFNYHFSIKTIQDPPATPPPDIFCIS